MRRREGVVEQVFLRAPDALRQLEGLAGRLVQRVECVAQALEEHPLVGQHHLALVRREVDVERPCRDADVEHARGLLFHLVLAPRLVEYLVCEGERRGRE